MILSNRTTSLFAALVFIFLNSFILSYRLESGANAQSSCKTPPVSVYGIRDTWPQGAEVSVNIDSFWSSDKESALEKAFDNWEFARFTNCSRVTYGSATNDPVPQGIRDGSTRASALSVNVFPTSALAYERNVIGANGRVENQVLGISSCKTDLHAITSIMAHEIGHSYGLANCYAESKPPLAQLPTTR